MNTDTHINSELVHPEPSPTSTAHRRRRHLAVYHRALRSARTPEQRAAVAARYRQLFLMDSPSAALASGEGQMLDLKVVTDAELVERARNANAAVARAAHADHDRQCRDVTVTVAA